MTKLIQFFTIKGYINNTEITLVTAHLKLDNNKTLDLNTFEIYRIK